ncbi:MAG: FKBP-type peptidyl-prolyl cis-trans isomerase [Bacteroidota bacterium]
MNKILMLLGSAAMVGLVSCNKSDFDGYTRAENGLNYKFFTHDEKGLKPQVGDGVSFKYVFTLKSNDSVLVNSALVSQDGTGVTKFVMPKSSFVGSIEDALMMMSVNDSASFMVSADSFFLKTNQMSALPPFVKPNDFIKAELKLVEVKTKADLDKNQKEQEAQMAKMAEAEKPLLAKYIADNKITVVPTASGLYYIETTKGKGAHAKAGDMVTVQYKGTLLDGKEFDSSYGRPEPFKFILGQGQVIAGWDEALQLMAKGGKAKLVLPSSIAYGARGAGPILPFSSLVFEVELVDFEAAPAAPAQQMPGQ